MVKRGHEVDLEYSRKEIIDRMNNFFGYSVIEKLKPIKFDDEKELILNKNSSDNVTKNNFHKKIVGVKNEKIKKALIELTKSFKKK